MNDKTFKTLDFFLIRDIKGSDSFLCFFLFKKKMFIYLFGETASRGRAAREKERKNPKLKKC